ncbi:hypothetical protein ABKN59_012045 [Abortiporus biennis]
MAVFACLSSRSSSSDNGINRRPRSKMFALSLPVHIDVWRAGYGLSNLVRCKQLRSDTPTCIVNWYEHAIGMPERGGSAVSGWLMFPKTMSKDSVGSQSGWKAYCRLAQMTSPETSRSIRWDSVHREPLYYDRERAV